MKKTLKRILITLTLFLTLIILGITLFFKTDLFYDQKVIWVETAMSTTSHQYLATWFLSQDEIDTILASNAVVNETNTSSDSVSITESTQEVNVYSISGATYTGTVVTVSDPSAVSLIDTTENNSGQKLSTVVSETDALVAINAAGFSFRNRSSSSSIINSLTIIDGELLYGDEDTTYSMIGLTENGILMLGNYTYEEAVTAGITDAIEFGPFLVVNGEAQVTSTSAGGIQPRTAIGQTADGTFIFVVIEGRTSSSLGATYYDLQQIMLEYGAVNATNLDGGGSSAMFYEGELMNTLSNGSERSIPNAFIVTL